MTKNNVKTVIALSIITLFACALMFTACSKAPEASTAGTSSLEGTTWILSSGSAEGQDIDMVEMFGEITYEFKANGVVTTAMAGQEIDTTYTQDGNTITIDNGDGSKSTLTLDGDKMTIEEQGAILEFTKK